MRGRLNHFHPQAPDQLGEFQALDLRTGETLWRQRLRVPYSTSALTTGGGLVFIGDWGRRVHAYDARTGEPLWRSRLPTMANGFPITYAVDGRQFVAFVAGPSIGGSSWATILPGDLPEERNPRGGSGVFVSLCLDASSTKENIRVEASATSRRRSGPRSSPRSSAT